MQNTEKSLDLSFSLKGWGEWVDKLLADVLRAVGFADEDLLKFAKVINQLERNLIHDFNSRFFLLGMRLVHPKINSKTTKIIVAPPSESYTYTYLSELDPSNSMNVTDKVSVYFEDQIIISKEYTIGKIMTSFKIMFKISSAYIEDYDVLVYIHGSPEMTILTRNFNLLENL